MSLHYKWTFVQFFNSCQNLSAVLVLMTTYFHLPSFCHLKWCCLQVWKVIDLFLLVCHPAECRLNWDHGRISVINLWDPKRSSIGTNNLRFIGTSENLWQSRPTRGLVRPMMQFRWFANSYKQLFKKCSWNKGNILSSYQIHNRKMNLQTLSNRLFWWFPNFTNIWNWLTGNSCILVNGQIDNHHQTQKMESHFVFIEVKEYLTGMVVW